MRPTPDPAGPALPAALDPATAPAALVRLARHRRRPVRAAVAANPNTPLDVLDGLARVFPSEVATNPVLAWLLLENSDWPSTLHPVSRHRLLSSPRCPEGLLWWAARFGTWEDRRSVALHPDAPPALLQLLAGDPHREVARTARAHRCLHHALARPVAWQEADWDPSFLPGDVITLLDAGQVPAWLIGAIRCTSPDLARAVARSPHAGHDALGPLLADDDPSVRASARAHPRAPGELVTALDQLESGSGVLDHEAVLGLGSSAFIRVLMARHPSLPPEVLRTCETDGNWRIREALAANPTAPMATLVRLAVDADKDVRVAVVGNPSTPAFIISALSNDRTDEVRARCAERLASGEPGVVVHDVVAVLDELASDNDDVKALLAAVPQTPSEVLVALSTDADWRVRFAAAMNPSLDEAALLRCVADNDADVRRAALGTGRVPATVLATLVEDSNEGVRRLVAVHTTDSSLLRALTLDAGTAVRAAVAANPSSGVDALVTLAGDTDADVRLALATRPLLPGPVVERLLGDEDAAVKRALVARPDLSPKHLALLFGRGGRRAAETCQQLLRNGDVPAPALAALLRRHPWISDTVLSSPHGAQALDLLAADPSWRVRQQVAGHPSTDAGLLSVLAGDLDYDVRMAVARHPSTPVEALVRLASDQHGAVRSGLCTRADLPAQCVDALLFDEDDDVRTAAASHPALSDEARALRVAFDQGAPVDPQVLRDFASGNAHQRLLAASHPATAPRLLGMLVRDESWRVREAVAHHPSATRIQLQRLGADGDRDVRRAVAQHHRTPVQVLVTMRRDADDSVRAAALVHPRMPSEMRRSASHAVITRLLRSASVIDRALAAASDDIGPRELSRRRHWQSPDWLVRHAVVRNLRTPLSIIERLAQDADGTIAAHAAGRLLPGQPS